MPVTTWTAGQVLAAQDLNDTFASKLDTSAYTAPGLVLTKAETFSAVSAVNVNNCFSSTYENYLVVYVATSSGTNQNNLRLRVSGTDATANYNFRALDVFGGGVITGAATSQDHFRIGYQATQGQATTVFIAKPNVAAATVIRSENWYDRAGTMEYTAHSGSHTASTAYTGLSIISTSGTITGSIRVYGYRNS